jgi:signal transduction histidine kinase
MPAPMARELGRDIARMTHIVGQLLEIAELEAFSVGEADIADLRAVCVEVAEFIAPLALAEKKSLSLDAPDGPVWINGSAEVLFRAIRNAAENAIRHTAAGTAVEISIAEDGSVAILDRGPGIAAADRGLVFQRFWRKDRGEATGAGLGLSIVRRIVDAHHGAILVKDRPGGGCQFVLRFIRSGGPGPTTMTEAAADVR